VDLWRAEGASHPGAAVGMASRRREEEEDAAPLPYLPFCLSLPFPACPVVGKLFARSVAPRLTAARKLRTPCAPVYSTCFTCFSALAYANAWRGRGGGTTTTAAGLGKQAYGSPPPRRYILLVDVGLLRRFSTFVCLFRALCRVQGCGRVALSCCLTGHSGGRMHSGSYVYSMTLWCLVC